MNTINLTCEYCSSPFASQENLNKHIKKYHSDIRIPISVISSNAPTLNEISRVAELEFALKLSEMSKKYELQALELEMSKKYELMLKDKDIEIERLKNKHLMEQIEQLKKSQVVQVTQIRQNKSKKQEHQEQEIPTQEQEIPSQEQEIPSQEQEQPTLKQSKLSQLEYLEKFNTENLPITECINLMNDDAYNKYLDCCCINGVDKNILTTQFFLESDFVEQPAENAVKIAGAVLSKLEPNEIPFHYNKTKKELYIKTDEEWIMDNERNADKVNDLLIKLIKSSLKSVQYAVSNTITIFKSNPVAFKKRYDKTYADWVYKNQHEYMKKLSPLYDEADEKKSALKKIRTLMRDWE